MAKKYNNPFLFSAIVIAAAIIAGGVVLWHNKFNDNQLASNMTSQDGKSGSQKSGQTGDNQSSTNTNTTTPSKTPDSQTPTQVTEPSKSSTSSNQITGVISHSAVSGNQLQIRVLINQLLTSGTCKLTLTNGDGKTYSASADVASNPSSATCQGFNVPLNQLGSGNWNISISVTSGSKQGIITGQTKI